MEKEKRGAVTKKKQDDESFSLEKYAKFARLNVPTKQRPLDKTIVDYFSGLLLHFLSCHFDTDVLNNSIHLQVNHLLIL